MKTIKVTTKKTNRIFALTIMLIAISTLSYSQTNFIKDSWVSNLKSRIFQSAETNNLCMNVNYYEETEWIESPVITRTICVNSVDVVYEASLIIESWMTAPFENALEANVEIESWMTTPFEEAIEAEISVENWMTTPFENVYEEAISMETWMTAPESWIN